MARLVGLASGEEQERLRRPLLVSVVGHGCLVAVSLLATVMGHGSSIWGESGPAGGAATVRLVSAASIPLPAPSTPTRNRVATENQGLHYPEPPQPEPKTTPPKPVEAEKAVELPAANAKVTPKVEKVEKKEEIPEKPAAPPTPKAEPKKAPEPKPATPRQVARLRRPETPSLAGNEIPYGQGGPVQGPYGIFETEAGTGGLSFSGGGGEFASRYSWYVRAIRNRISANWLKGTVDPSVLSAPRVYATFDILRDGRVVNVQLTASSGVASLDRSALRAVYDSSPMPALPADYPGSSVAVEFWFDFRR
ncbi:MAG: TonB family protein [Acidobacteria bacterium]|nr:TonB family protein [Acidobacteriota bacterium]